MRMARILVAAAAAAFWTTVTLVADQHGHAPVTHTAQAHGTPTTTTAPKPPASTTTKHATPAGGTHHDGDHHSGTHTASPSPIATKIQSHPNLAAKVTAMLPQGMTMNDAARGFKNQGQFIAALHASQRTGIPFADLKREMVREHESLGQAIHELRPSANGSREAEHAEHDADHDLGGSHSGTGGTATGTTTGTTSTTTSTTTRKHDK